MKTIQQLAGANAGTLLVLCLPCRPPLPGLCGGRGRSAGWRAWSDSPSLQRWRGEDGRPGWPRCSRVPRPRRGESGGSEGRTRPPGPGWCRPGQCSATLQVYSRPVLTAISCPVGSKSAAVSGASHEMAITCFPALMSQQTSFLSSPTLSARFSLMGEKMRAVAGAQCGARLQGFLYQYQYL